MFPPPGKDVFFLSFPIQQGVPSIHLTTVQTQNKVAQRKKWLNKPDYSASFCLNDLHTNHVHFLEDNQTATSLFRTQSICANMGY